jgi:hypothetical protein
VCVCVCIYTHTHIYTFRIRILTVVLTVGKSEVYFEVKTVLITNSLIWMMNVQFYSE